MKRIFTLLFVLTISMGAYAQVDRATYLVTFGVKVRDGVDNHSGSCTNRFDMQVKINTEASERILWPLDLNPIGTSYKSVSQSLTLQEGQSISWLRFKGQREWKNWFNCKGNNDWGGFIYPSFSGCMAATTWNGVIPNWDGNLTVTVTPSTNNLFYFDRGGDYKTASADKLLPELHKITIKATDGYPANVYGWEYLIAGGQWTSFSPSLYNRNTLTFCGKDIDPNFRENVIINGGNPTKSVTVRYKTSCGTYSNTMTLIPLLSGPDYIANDGVLGLAPTCSYLYDGKIKVTFSRELYDGETITFYNGADAYDPQNLTKADLTDNTYILEGFHSGSYTIKFQGRYKGKNVYTQDPNTQIRTLSVPVRDPIVFTATPFDVHCFDGSDGRVDVTATGGTGTYTTFLDLGATNLTQQTFGKGVPDLMGSFKDLPTNTYTIRLIDSNGCESRNDINPPAIKYDRLVGQPAVRTALIELENIEPTGFGLTDGHITVRAQDGSKYYTFEWKNKTDGRELLPDPTETDGNTMKSTLSGLGKGEYYVIAKDAQYSQAFPATEPNLSGCYDTMSFVVTQPPLLTVYLEQKHFVTCNAYTDGELKAVAEGGRPFDPGNNNTPPYVYEWYAVNKANDNLTPFTADNEIAMDRPSAWYRVKISDKNGIVAWSPDFNLVQPDALKLTFNTSTLLCNGDTNGTSEVKAQGGTPPYRYSWSTEETTPLIANLTDGWYTAVATDTRGCTTYDKTEVTVPGGLEVEADVANPVCYQYTNGSITLDVTGGASGYTYFWSNGSTGPVLENLTEGAYSVIIRDANDCFISRNYELVDPQPLTVSIGENRLLCKDQVLELNPSISDPQAQYLWTKDGASFASTANVTLKDAGSYKLLITDSNGCYNEDDVVITRSDNEISASIVVATRVPVGGTFRIANICHPAPDSIRWIVPKEAKVMGKTNDYIELVFPTKGEYTVGLRSLSGYCEATTYEPVRVVSSAELTDYQTPVEPYIKQFMVTPNPTTGRFTATVELRESADFALSLYSSQGVIVSQQKFSKQSIVSADFELPPGSSRGIYVLQLITAQGYSTFKVVLE